MPFKIVRNDITKMICDAIVNTANSQPIVGPGCDRAVYTAAGWDELLAERQRIGEVPEGESFLTGGGKLPAKYIIHTVSPLYIDGNSGEEEKLRRCYRSSLKIALEQGYQSVAFPLISTGSFGYPKEEGLRIALDEINAFLLNHTMDITLVVFGEKLTQMSRRLYPGLEAYIDRNYVQQRTQWEYSAMYGGSSERPQVIATPETERILLHEKRERPLKNTVAGALEKLCAPLEKKTSKKGKAVEESAEFVAAASMPDEMPQSSLAQRMNHLSDTFSQYLLYLIESKGLTNAQVYKAAIVDKKVFSKIKNNPDYHPQKLTAMCLCVGAQLNLDETRDLLARAGYALSPCDKTDVIFSYFIENKIYDMIELDITLEEFSLPCLIQ